MAVSSAQAFLEAEADCIEAEKENYCPACQNYLEQRNYLQECQNSGRCCQSLASLESAACPYPSCLRQNPFQSQNHPFSSRMQFFQIVPFYLFFTLSHVSSDCIT